MNDQTPTEPMPTPAAMVAARPPLAFVPVDQAAVDEAVRFLNQALNESGLRLATVVSDYIVQKFFATDPGQLTQRGRHKPLSYAALCEREDLEMGAATLQRLVRIGLQIKAMPPELGSALTPGQHRALLVVAEPTHKVELAKAALAEHWTAERLEEVIAQEKPAGGKRPGRAAVPEVVKAIAALEKAVEALGSVDVLSQKLVDLGEAEGAAARARIAAIVKQVEALSSGW